MRLSLPDLSKFEQMADDLADMPETMKQFVAILRDMLGEMQTIRASLLRIEEQLHDDQ